MTNYKNFGIILEIGSDNYMSRSVFPEGVDSFQELFDLPYNKIEEANRLTALKMKSSLTNDEQNEVLILTASLQPYLITPETWNKFADTLVAVEQFFNQNVQGFIENKQVIWDSYIKQFKLVGKWVVGRAYKFQNLVSDENGDLHICTTDHVSTASNSPLLDQTLWAKLSAKGDKGDIGLNAFYKGDWNVSSDYAMGDAVCFGRDGYKPGVTYIALRANTGKSPSNSPDDWQIYSQLYVGTEEPLGSGVGLHFIKVLD